MQEKAAEVLANGGTPTQAVRAAGYKPSVVKKPSAVTKTPSFKAALAKFGLTEKLIVGSLVQDIKKKKGKRVQELKLGADILHLTEKNPGDDPKGGDKTQVNIFVWGNQNPQSS
jgi:hypothetical protein